MKQTAVEWMEEQLKQVLPINQMNDILIQDLFKQAKERENALLNYHLEQFAEECKKKGKAYQSMMGMQIDRPHIDKLLYDYKLKNNIK